MGGAERVVRGQELRVGERFKEGGRAQGGDEEKLTGFGSGEVDRRRWR